MMDYRVTALKKACVIGSGLVSAAILARYLGVEIRADYAVIMNAAAILIVVLNFGVSNAYQGARRSQGPLVARAFITYSLILFCALVMLVLLFAGILGNQNLAIFTVAAVSLVRMQLLSYNLVESIKGAAVASILGSLVELFVVVLLWLYLPSSLFLGLATILAKDAIIAIISLFAIRSSYLASSPKKERALSFLKGGLKDLPVQTKASLFQSFPLFLLTVLIVVNYKVDVLFLDGLNVDTTSIGVFVIGVLVSEYLWIFADVFKDVQISRTARGGTDQDVARASRAAVAITLIVYFVFLLFGKWSIITFFGEEFARSYRIAAFMLLANIWMIPCKVLGAYFISQNKPGLYLAGMLAAVALNCVLNFALIPLFETSGAIAASIFSYFVGGAVITFAFTHQTGIPMRATLVIQKADLKGVFGGKRHAR